MNPRALYVALTTFRTITALLMLAPIISVEESNRTIRLIVVRNGIPFTYMISIRMTISECLSIISGGKGVMTSVFSSTNSFLRRVDVPCRYGLLIPHTFCAILIALRLIGKFLIVPESIDFSIALVFRPSTF